MPGIDYPDLTIWGWTPTDDQWSTAAAIALGAAGALVLMLLWRRARKAVLAATVGVILIICWIRFTR